MNFPQYRKYKNGMSYFMIPDETHFTELKCFAGKVDRYEFEVKILPDRNYIQDMLYQYEESWEIITREEYESIAAKC